MGVASKPHPALPLHDELQFAGMRRGPDAKDVFSLDRAIAARTNPGAPPTANVTAEIPRWKNMLGAVSGGKRQEQGEIKAFCPDHEAFMKEEE